MFCQNCGSKLKDGARFCTTCGAPVSATAPRESAGSTASSHADPTSASPETNPYMPASAQGHASMGDQISRARRKSRRRIPMVLIVVLVVLGLATVAAAAVYVYNTYFREEPQAERVQEEANSHDVYNQVLDDFRASEDNDWAQDGRSDLTDLYGVQRLADGHLASFSEDSPTLNDLELGTVSYAYYDLGQDGTDDLLISVVRDNGESKLLAIYTTDGSQPVSLTDGDIADGAIWRVVNKGELTCCQVFSEDDSDVRSQNILYTVANGRLQVEDSYWTALFGTSGIDRAFSYGYHGPVGDADNSERLTSNYIDDKFDNLPNASGIDWQPLSAWSH